MPDLGEIGEDPDPRFTLANERTFLAWNRTALALVAAGLAAAQLLDRERLFLAIPLVVLGGVTAVVGYGRWHRRERAMRLQEPLRYGSAPLVLAVAIALLALVALGVALAAGK